jgi:hypothetical protein
MATAGVGLGTGWGQLPPNGPVAGCPVLGEGAIFEAADRRALPGPEREENTVQLAVSWKTRPMDSAALNRLMTTWGAYESALGAHREIRRVAWWMFADGTGGFTVLESADADALYEFVVEWSVALNEFLEPDCRPVLTLDAARPAVVAAVAHKAA